MANVMIIKSLKCVYIVTKFDIVLFLQKHFNSFQIQEKQKPKYITVIQDLKHQARICMTQKILRFFISYIY